MYDLDTIFLEDCAERFQTAPRFALSVVSFWHFIAASINFEQGETSLKAAIEALSTRHDKLRKTLKIIKMWEIVRILKKKILSA